MTLKSEAKHGQFLSLKASKHGKTTQIAILSEYLSKRSIPFTVTRAGGTAVSKRSRYC
jgi:hypothetical protein